VTSAALSVSHLRATRPYDLAPRPRAPASGSACTDDLGASQDSGVVVTLSPQAQDALSSDGSDRIPESDGADAVGGSRAFGRPLSEKEQAVVEQLQDRDAEVRAHEAAHAAAAGGMGGRPSFSYQTGPDGRRYAIGGEVGIDMTPGRSPSETIARAEQIRTAALAPADPSSQDRAVAASASAMEAKARAEQIQQRVEEAHDAQAIGDKPAAGARSADDAALTLTTERRAANDGHDHAHTAGGCPFCGRAAAAYR
jgi:hypothetical protein